MELSLNPISPEKQALRDILNALYVFEPVIKKTDFKKTNKMAMISQVPKFIKIMQDNEDKLNPVFNLEFFNHIKKLAE